MNAPITDFVGHVLSAFPFVLALGVLLPTHLLNPSITLHLWTSLISNERQSLLSWVAQALACWFLVNGATWLFLYTLFRDWISYWKYNKNIPATSLLQKEFRRSVVSVCIGAVWGFALQECGAVVVGPIKPPDIASLLFYVVVFGAWGDAHFYWVHRGLHSHPAIYNHIHKVHHESMNTNPWSGLSFHPIESTAYFSATAGVLLVPSCPLFALRLLVYGLVIFPNLGHHGYGYQEPGYINAHWVHHTKFNCNFGGTMCWDLICGTNEQTKPATRTS
jgi:sterol desaturase/sphingolipid hydroxylase (fatty acid hydroxylase superfamily)